MLGGLSHGCKICFVLYFRSMSSRDWIGWMNASVLLLAQMVTCPWKKGRSFLHSVYRNCLLALKVTTRKEKESGGGLFQGIKNALDRNLIGFTALMFDNAQGRIKLGPWPPLCIFCIVKERRSFQLMYVMCIKRWQIRDDMRLLFVHVFHPRGIKTSPLEAIFLPKKDASIP